MIHRRLLGFLIGGVLVSGCGGGSASPPPVSTATAAPIPGSATATQAISASGGSVSATTGAQTVSVTVPPGAFPSGATLTVTLYGSATLPRTFQSAGRRPQSVPTGASALAGVVVDAGSDALAAPLTLSLIGGSVPTGSVGRLSGFNTTFDDVAPLTTSGAALTTASDPHYPGATLAAKTLYVFYTVPTANVGSGDGSVTVSGPTSVPASTQGTYVASEATANGFPYLGRTFTYSLTNPQVGTLDPNSGVLTASYLGGSGNVQATDKTLSSRSGSLVVSAASARPGASGISATYTGTLVETGTNNAISSTPVASATTSNVTTTVATSTDAGGNAVFTANETEAAQLRTTNVTTTSTIAYQSASNSVNVRTLKSVAVDSNGNTFETDYGSNNGLATILPEQNGATFTNDAGLKYLETDLGTGASSGTQGVSTERDQNANGTYTQTTNTINTVGQPAQDVATENADLSGSYYIHSLGNGATTAGRAYVFTPPSGTLSYTYYNLNANGTLGTIRLTAQPFNWLAGITAAVTEKDTITANQRLDPSCSPASTFAGNATQVKQVVTTYDSILGVVETKTTSSYDVAGPGTVCTVVSDMIQNFYDYSQQEGNIRLFPASSSTPVVVTSISETLSLQKFNVTPTANSRSPQSISSGLILPRSVVSTRVEQLVHQRVLRQVLARRAAGGL